jgi:hypothetical protein
MSLLNLNQTHIFANLKSVLLPDHAIYILIDPILGEPLGVELEIQSLQRSREAFWQSTIHQITLDKATKLPIQLHPYLIEINDVEHPLLESLFELAIDECIANLGGGLNDDSGCAHHIGGWIQSKKTPEELCTHMSDLFKLRISQLHPRLTYLRLADPRVMSLTHYLLGHDLNKCLQGVLLWSYLTPLGALKVIQPNEYVGPLELPLSIWKVVRDGEILNRALKCWLESNPDLLNMYDENEIYHQLVEGIHEAHQASFIWKKLLASEADKARWAVTKLCHPSLSPTMVDLRPLLVKAEQNFELHGLKNIHDELIELLENNRH